MSSRCWIGKDCRAAILAFLLITPALTLAQLQVPRLTVLSPDETLRSVGLPFTISGATEALSGYFQDIGSRFLESRGGDVVRDINLKTGVDLVKFLQFVIQIVFYLFVQIYAVLADIAAKLSTK